MSAKADWRIRLLDHFQLMGADGVVALTSRKAIALLAYLALQRDRTARRDMAANILWENVDTAQGRTNLRQTVAALRRLGAESAPLLVVDQETLRLAPNVELDTDRFEQLEGGDEAERRRAAELYRSSPLDGFVLRDAPAFSEWLAVNQALWRQRVVSLLLALMEEADRDGGGLNGAVATGLKLVALDPYNEAAHRGLMRAYNRQGRSALALAQYRSLSELLRRELQASPEAETLRLHRELQGIRRERTAASPAEAEFPASPSARSPHDHPARIAVVDDEADLREAVASYLRTQGFDAIECSGGAALDAALDAEPVDLVLLDVTMPVEDGFQIARRLGPAMPKIMLTARNDLIDRVVGLELGADDYIAKPFQLRELVARIRAVLRRASDRARPA